MKTLTAGEFEAAVGLDPAWASKLTEPVEITDYCDMTGSKITHLSPLLHFKGKDEDGDSAAFWKCQSLKTAEGNFSGFVSFMNAGIQKIGSITCGKNKKGNSADFYKCQSLKTAEGTFPGAVDFSHSGIEKIGELTCGKNLNGMRADFQACPNLTHIPIHFKQSEIKANPELIQKLIRNKAAAHLRKQAEQLEI